MKALKFKGKILKTTDTLRPTPQIVRKAIFDILGDIRGLSFLELFAGSGSVGMEALLRGVEKVVFVERDRLNIKIIKKNLELLNSSNFKIIPQDAFEAIKDLNENKEKFDIIFLDPPYLKDMAKKSLKNLALYDILTKSGFIIIQHYKKEILPKKIGDLVLFKEKKYGEHLLSFYCKSNYINSLK
jgi:16S rRNA (guanine(966)-N(2))-methyltransferase RsmD